ncbi:MAG: type IV toxin-antitoxin system AbiEi family antitoxin [Candidatus Diapherotrites archaeon]
MLKLTDKRLISILWMLKNKEKKWNILELRKGTEKMLGGKDTGIYSQKKPFQILNLTLTYGPTFSFVKELEKSGFLLKDSRTNEYTVSKASDLVKLISFTRPFNSLEKIEYYSPLDFASTLKTVGNAGFDYAFTIFAGSELFTPYVKTNQVHIYVRPGDEPKWKKYLFSKKFLKAEKGQANLFLIPTKQEVFFRQAEKVKNFSIVPLPILLSDLFSSGGLAEEQAKNIMENWLDNRL